MEPVGQHAAVFAADGRSRHRIARAAIAAGVALLAAWLIALALGVLGGFGSLPSLPSLHSRPSDPASAPAPHSRREAARADELRIAPKRVSGPGSLSRTVGGSSSPASPTKPTPTRVSPSPSTSAPATSSGSHGLKLGTTRATGGGKPVGSPGNGPGGSGAPGQLR